MCVSRFGKVLVWSMGTGQLESSKLSANRADDVGLGVALSGGRFAGDMEIVNRSFLTHI